MNEGSRWQRLGTPLGLFAFAFAIRCLPWPFVLGPARTHFFGNDAYYHMRRVAYSLAHFPATLGFDPYLNHPEGARAIWPPLFDLAVACALLPVHALGGLAAAERAAAFIAPLFGAATVVALYALARRLFDSQVALVAGLVLCVMSGHYWYSQLGFLDHHAAVALIAVALLLCALPLLRDRPRTSAAAAFGVVVAAAFQLWPGALLYVAIVEIGLLAHWAWLPQRESALRVAELRAGSHAIACLLLLPAAFIEQAEPWTAYSPAVLSRFQPWLLAALAAHALACRVLWTGPRGASAAARRAQVVALGAAVLGLSALALPELTGAATEAWRWLGKQETFQRIVAESLPLFYMRGEFTTGIAELRLSRFVYLLPFALAAMCLQARGDERRAERWLFAWWSVALLLATVQQKRFFNTSSVAVSLLMGWAAVNCVREVRARWPQWRPASIIAPLATAALALFLLAPGIRGYTPTVSAGVERLRGGPLRLGTQAIATRGLLRTAEWIAANTPQTAGFDDLGAEPEYGVLAHWDLGHILIYVGQRPTVVGNFGDDLGDENFALHRRYYLASETLAAKILDRVSARYVVVEDIREEHRERLGPRTMLRRLTEATLRDLEQHRLIYESPLPRKTTRFTPGFRVFERVAGAVVEGRAPAGASVSALLELQLPEGRRRKIENGAIADAAGVYRLRLAHPSAGSGPTESWRIESGGRAQELRLSEAAVASGEIHSGPEF